MHEIGPQPTHKYMKTQNDRTKHRSPKRKEHTNSSLDLNSCSIDRSKLLSAPAARLQRSQAKGHQYKEINFYV